MTALGVGIIGTGFGARVLLPAFRSLPRVQIVGIAGQNQAKTHREAQLQGIPRAFDSWEELIDDKSIDAVAVAVPPALHYPVVMRALQSGKHILCEKPFGLGASEAAEMLALARTSGMVCMVNYMFRMAPERLRLKEMLGAGAIGQLRRVNVEWTVPGRASRPGAWSWQFEARNGGGTLFALGAHVVDYLQWLLGPITAVATHFSTLGAMRQVNMSNASIAEDTLDAMLLIEGEIPVSLNVSNAIQCGRGHWLTVYGERGVLSVGSPNLHDAVLGTGLFEGDPNTGCLHPVSTTSLEDRPVADGRVLLVQRLAETFVEGIAAGRPTSPSFEDGWRAQVTMDAMRQAHAERRWVMIAS